MTKLRNKIVQTKGVKLRNEKIKFVEQQNVEKSCTKETVC